MPRWLALLFAAVLAVWAVVALWIAPLVIADAHAGESLAVFNRIMAGQETTPLAEYLAAWRGIALRVTVALLAAGLLVHLVLPHVRDLPQLLRGSVAGLPATGVAGASLFAVWFGIIAGIAEAINGLVRHRIRHLPTGEVVSGELVWLVPVVAATTFVAIVLVLAGLDRLARSRQALLGLAAPLIVALGTYSFLRALGLGLAGYAVALFAIGLAVVTTRALSEHGPVMRSLVRRSTPLLALALALWAVAVPLWRTTRSARAVAARPAAPNGSPNVILLIWDTARAHNLSIHGYVRETTPALERLAAAGIVFESAFATSPWSLPSHAGMFTGRYPHELTVSFSAPLDDTHPTLGELLSDHGYATAGFTANLFYGSATYGIARGLSYYDDRPPISPSTVLHTWWLSRTVAQNIRLRGGNYENMLRRDAAHVNDALLRWIRRQGDRPFLAIVNHFDAHHPYLPPPPFDRAFTAEPARGVVTSTSQRITPELQHELITAYDACLRYLDHQLELLVEELRTLGKLDNTLIIVTSDHGEQFAEERPDLAGHALSLFPTVLHVPLVLYFPAQLPQNVRRGETVSIRDIPATVMDVVGLADRSPFPGTSLIRYVNGEATEAELAEPRLAATPRHRWASSFPQWPAARGDQFAIIDGHLQYILDGNGRDHLYDIAGDPFAQHNLASTASPLVDHYRAMLDSLIPVRDGQRRAVAVPSQR
jgi:arylsulfatase A-like enzyme